MERWISNWSANPDRGALMRIEEYLW
jgi:hypothetical protein